MVDLTEHLADPVEVLFGTQLGGGTDINRAIAYSQSLIIRPSDSTFVLISDLYEGSASALAELGVPAFACTSDAFPDLLAVALSKGDVARWAERTFAP